MHTGKVVGKPYRGKPDVRFDEGAKGMRPWRGLRHRHMRKPPETAIPLSYSHRTEALLY
jgi:hypothetical protein